VCICIKIINLCQKSSEIVDFRGFFYVKSSNFGCGQSSFFRRLKRPVSLIIAAQNLRLPACFDTLLQLDEVGIILKNAKY
jgi:hypothetical protein